MRFLKGIKKTHPDLYTLFIAIAVIAFWRGAWGLMDLYLFPGNELYSYVASAVLGLLLLYLNDFKLTELK